ncbi:MAG: DinB family protein [Anaerolineales bacterium]|nr:DinB family protein [Anaerolineales bacterium]
MTPLPPPTDLVLEYRAELLARLEQQPAALAAALAPIPAARWRLAHTPDGRTVHLAVAHLRDLEALAYLPHVRQILAEDLPTLTAAWHHNWSAAGYDPAEPMTAILMTWSQARTELLACLRPLPPAGWGRLGFHPPSGKRTVQWWVERAYLHAQGHLVAIQQAA